MPEDEPKLDAVAVAIAYYNQPLRERCFKKLCKQFGLPDTDASSNRLARLVRDLEERGLIRHEVLRENAEFLPRNPRLEDELRYKFDLRQAVVMDISSLGLPKSPPHEHLDHWARYDDEIHDRLGAWGGRLLTSCIRSGDTIATGGGRGPHFTVAKSNISTGQRYSGNILPLTGQITARAWNHSTAGSHSQMHLDADHVASQLYSKLGTRGRLGLLHRPITELRHAPRTEQVDVAIFGIGALGGGHRFKHFQNLEDVRSVHGLLQDINTLAEGIERKAVRQGVPFYHPVGDVCNYYFLVEGEDGERLGKDWQALEGKIRQLNKAFKSATPESLGRIAREGMVLAVAGGPHKAFTIRHVLRNSREGTWITHLVTDQTTAQWILEKENDSGNGGGTAKQGAPTAGSKTLKP